jgi:hypothetical protein
MLNNNIQNYFKINNNMSKYHLQVIFLIFIKMIKNHKQAIFLIFIKKTIRILSRYYINNNNNNLQYTLTIRTFPHNKYLIKTQ